MTNECEGEVAEMMLDGTLCAGCGAYDESLTGSGVPELCPDCRADPVVSKAWGSPPPKKRRRGRRGRRKKS